MKRNLKQLKTLASLALALSLSACGEASFQTGTQIAAQAAPGSYTVPAKVDILLVQDNTGSTVGLANEIHNETFNLLNSLSNKGWDYHFASIPITLAADPVNQRNLIEQVIASKHDANWDALSAWIKPYPGALATDTSLSILNTLFRTPSTYSEFPATGQTSYGNDEPGFESIKWILTHAQTKSARNFLRSDANLAIIVVSNGNDNSGLSDADCLRPDGTYFCSSNQTILNNYYNAFRALKPSASNVKFFSAVAMNTQNSNTCRGTTAKKGTNYIAMAQYFASTPVDLCQSNSVSSLLSQLDSSLQPITYEQISRFIVIDEEPNPASIHVGKILSDGSTVVNFTEGDPNGWNYLGYQSNVPVIQALTPNGMTTISSQSGYTIELLGTAVIVGSEEPVITYTPKVN